MLLALVFGVFLVLLGLTAGALVTITSARLTAATLNATISRDASLAELFVNANLRADDLLPGAASAQRIAELGGRLAALTRPGEMLVVEIRAPDGATLLASDPSLRGRRQAVSPAMLEALGGSPSAALESPNGAAPRLIELLPILQRNGAPLGIVAITRDAAPILAEVGQAQREVLIVVLVAAAVLAIVLLIIFRTAQARLAQQQERLVEATRRDALTEMLNHGAVVTLLAEELERARSAGHEMAVALVDIDNFRLFNDTHGHQAADRVLLEVARALADAAEPGDHVARYGPDEFLLARTGGGTAVLGGTINDLRRRLDETSVQFGASERLPVTISAGLASFPGHAASVTELLSAVTVALGEAKAGGGDQLRVARAEAPEAVIGGFDVLQGLVIAVDTKDRYTKRHSEDVARYATFLAERLGLDTSLRETIQVAGLLHDVGKIGIPDAVLRKPGRLTAEEFDAFRQHVAVGEAIVRNVPNVELIRAGIRYHHERWDGRGYLDGLEGETIPLIGRILAVADAFSAMTTTRPYRKALPLEEALKRLGDAAGNQLEEDLVAAFINGLETARDAPLPGMDATSIWPRQERVA